MGAKLLDFGDDTPENSLMHSAAAAKKPDFSGWATKANVTCTDGRTILPDAFKHQDKTKVPLVWQHGHDDPDNVLGHAILENRPEGVYAYGYFNGTPKGKNAKELVSHDDIDSLSIYANKLVEKAKQVSHGIIREVSLVLARANPGAFIDNIELQHSDGEMVTLNDEAIIFPGTKTLSHSDEEVPAEETAGKTEEKHQEVKEGEDATDVEKIYEDMSHAQKEAVHILVGAAVEHAAETSASTEGGTAAHSDTEGNRIMSRNVFEEQNGGKKKDGEVEHSLSHDDMREIVEDAKTRGSLKHAMEAYALKHGIESIDTLFPDAKAISNTPEFDKRRTEWVAGVLGGTRKSPFSRVKNFWADITHEEARAKGYITGTFKKEEYFGLAKRTTGPKTVYKKQKLDRDDIIDITDLDVVAWMKGEMRLMLDEEIARAVLIGDGRAVDDEDKITDPAGATSGDGIRSILHDHDLYAATINVNLDNAESKPSEVTDAILTHMGLYKGTGTPTFYTTLGMLTKLLLERDTMGRRLYRTAGELATELLVDRIVTVEVMEEETDLIGIIVNLQDYTLGADRGGEVSMFDDFDIDYNQYKYLIETRLSGALTKIRSALIVKKVAGSDTLVTPAEPTFNEETSAVTIVNTTGVVYKNGAGTTINNAGSPYTVAEGVDYIVRATPASGYYFSTNQGDEWKFRGVDTA